ncbi:hypothetical protein SEVIR_3G099650v4 [Setaria viridis]
MRAAAGAERPALPLCATSAARRCGRSAQGCPGQGGRRARWRGIRWPCAIGGCARPPETGRRPSSWRQWQQQRAAEGRKEGAENEYETCGWRCWGTGRRRALRSGLKGANVVDDAG